MADVMLLPTPPLPLTTPITFLILLSAWGGSRKSAGFVLREAQFSPQVSQLCVQFSLIVILLPGGTFIIGSRKEGVKPWLWLRDREIYGIICPVSECEPQAKHEFSGIDTMFLNEYERYAKCELRNMV